MLKAVVQYSGCWRQQGLQRKLLFHSQRSQYSSIISKTILDAIPRPQHLASLWENLRMGLENDPTRLVVLDDDPTGCQSVYDVNVLIDFSKESIKKQLMSDSKLFYILTNTRSLPEHEAKAVVKTAVANLQDAIRELQYHHPVEILSRSDSNLRGHFPAEIQAIQDASSVSFDATIVCPAFFEGGRITLNDVQYIMDGDSLVPVSNSRYRYSSDKKFPFSSANLHEWITEKSKGSIQPANIASISVQEIREGGPYYIANRLEALQGSTLIVNAVHEHDLNTFILGLLQAEADGMRFVYQTSASFVASRAGIQPRPLLAVDTTPLISQDSSSAASSTYLSSNSSSSSSSSSSSANNSGGVSSSSEHTVAMPRTNGGLIVMGSCTPTSTDQLNTLLTECHVVGLEIDAQSIIAEARGQKEREKLQLRKAALALRPSKVDELVARAVAEVDKAMLNGKDVVLFTSRTLDSSKSASAHDEDASAVSRALSAIVRGLKVQPAYIVAKGGITAYDTAVHGLNMKSARVLGQPVTGVCLWQASEECSMPGVNFLVFPGNFGDEKTLSKLAEKLGVPPLEEDGVPSDVTKLSVQQLPAASSSSLSSSFSDSASALSSAHMSSVTATTAAAGGRIGIVPPALMRKLYLAEAKGHAIPAFTISNIEGAVAVVRAGEALQSAVILQVTPSALRFSGAALLHMLQYFKKQSNTPIYIHIEGCQPVHDEDILDMLVANNIGGTHVDSISLDCSQDGAMSMSNEECTAWVKGWTERIHTSSRVVTVTQPRGAITTAVEAVVSKSVFNSTKTGHKSGVGECRDNDSGSTGSSTVADASMAGNVVAAKFVSETNIDILGICLRSKKSKSSSKLHLQKHGKFGGRDKDLELLSNVRRSVPSHVSLSLHNAALSATVTSNTSSTSSCSVTRWLSDCMLRGVSKVNMNETATGNAAVKFYYDNFRSGNMDASDIDSDDVYKDIDKDDDAALLHVMKGAEQAVFEAASRKIKECYQGGLPNDHLKNK